MSQVTPFSQESQVQLMRNLLACWFVLYVSDGDNLRLQQVLSYFLAVAIRFTPACSYVLCSIFLYVLIPLHLSNIQI